MGAAWLLTTLAVAGVLIGLWLGESRLLSCYLAAAGGGLLFGIALFWLLPEIATLAGWLTACALTVTACGVLALLDRIFLHIGRHGGHVAITPLLIATAIHSFVDGWSVRALASQNLADVAAPLGLTLHKVPEGLALGWIARRSLRSALLGAVTGISVELVTLAGAYFEPRISQSGFAAFGGWWTASAIAVICGSFLFLGLHAVLPNRRSLGVMLVFAFTLVIVGTIGLVERSPV